MTTAYLRICLTKMVQANVVTVVLVLAFVFSSGWGTANAPWYSLCQVSVTMQPSTFSIAPQNQNS